MKLISSFTLSASLRSSNYANQCIILAEIGFNKEIISRWRFAAITTIFLAAEKQWTVVDWKPKRLDVLGNPFGLGRIVQDGLAFRQNFSIRSYEIGADRTASVETLMNHLQDTALNYVKHAGNHVRPMLWKM